MKRVAHLLWRSQGGMRRHVKTIASRPPCGWETSGVFGPDGLRSYFDGVPFATVGRTGLLRAGRDADVIHAHGVNAGLAALTPGGPPVVLSLHVVVGASGRTARSPLASFLAKAIATRADAVIAVSRGAAAAAPRARVIPPAFEPLPGVTQPRSEMRWSVGAESGDVVAISVARLEAEKRLDLFVRAVETASCVGWIVGDGPERERLEALATDGRTRLLGHRDDVADLLAAADVFALPSTSESYGIAVAEAIGAGLPVIATRTGAIDELVGDAGIVVEPGDDGAFIDAFTKVAADATLRRQLADATRRVVRPDRDALIAAVGEVYDELAGGR